MRSRPKPLMRCTKIEVRSEGLRDAKHRKALMTDNFTGINGDTRVLGFFGETFRKSRVYGLYNYAFQALGLNFVYVPFHVTEIGAAIQAVRSLGIHAIGVTIPFKVAIIPHLQGIDDQAKRCGAVNAVVNRSGALFGSNTDGIGAVRALQECVSPTGKKIIIIGSGGAARAIAAELVAVGGMVRIVSIIDTEARAVATQTGCGWASWSDLLVHAQQADIIINATPIGAAGTDLEEEVPISVDALNADHVVMDIITAPRITRFLKEAETRGCRIVIGERMLLWQAASKFELFTGKAIVTEVMEFALEQQRASMS